VKKEKLIQIKEAAEILGVTTETLRRWDRAGKINAVRVGSRKDRRYKFSDIQKILNSLENNSNPKSKGNFLELFMHELINCLMLAWDFTLLENRHQKGGSQYGKDHITKWTGKIEGKPYIFE
jgi:excisionase family DNA binding protein